MVKTNSANGDHYQNNIADLGLNATRNLELRSCWKGLGKNKKILLEGTFW